MAPAVIGSDQIMRPGIEGLRYLAELADTDALPARLPAHAGTAPGQDTRHASAARLSPSLLT